MTEPAKCANEPCSCIVAKGGEHGKFCSEHCKEKAKITALRCDCQHPACR